MLCLHTANGNSSKAVPRVLAAHLWTTPLSPGCVDKHSPPSTSLRRHPCPPDARCPRRLFSLQDGGRLPGSSLILSPRHFPVCVLFQQPLGWTLHFQGAHFASQTPEEVVPPRTPRNSVLSESVFHLLLFWPLHPTVLTSDPGVGVVHLKFPSSISPFSFDQVCKHLLLPITFSRRSWLLPQEGHWRASLLECHSGLNTPQSLGMHNQALKIPLCGVESTSGVETGLHDTWVVKENYLFI